MAEQTNARIRRAEEAVDAARNAWKRAYEELEEAKQRLERVKASEARMVAARQEV